MDVDLRREQGGGDVLELGFRLQLDGHHRHVVVREVVLGQDFLRLLGVVDHDADDGGIGRVHKAQGHDVYVRARQGLHQFVESPHLVLDEDGELTDGAEVGLAAGVGCHGRKSWAGAGAFSSLYDARGD